MKDLYLKYRNLINQIAELFVILALLFAVLMHGPANQQPIIEKGYGALTGFLRSDFLTPNGGNEK